MDEKTAWAREMASLLEKSATRKLIKSTVELLDCLQSHPHDGIKDRPELEEAMCKVAIMLEIWFSERESKQTT